MDVLFIFLIDTKISTRNRNLLNQNSLFVLESWKIEFNKEKVVYRDSLSFRFFQLRLKSFFSSSLFWMELARTKFTFDIYTEPFREHFARYQTVCTPRVTMGTNSTIDPFVPLDTIVFNVVQVHVLRLVYPSNPRVWIFDSSKCTYAFKGDSALDSSTEKPVSYKKYSWNCNQLPRILIF